MRSNIDMNTIKLNLATLCAYMGMNTEEMARNAKIDVNHLKSVRAGRAKMTADDLLGLSNATGIPLVNIETRPEAQ